jgi:hypothetical protein
MPVGIPADPALFVRQDGKTGRNSLTGYEVRRDHIRSIHQAVLMRAA